MAEAVGGETTAVGRAARRAWAGPGRERDLLVQSLKAALAAVVAWLIAGQWLSAPMPFIAPWVAVVLVRATVYQSVAQAVQQVIAIAVGTALATVGGMAVGIPWLAMAVVLPLVLLLGSWPRLGDQGIYAATAALFTLTFHQATLDSALARVLEALLGAAVGVGVNMLILPPVHLRSTQNSVQQVTESACRTLRSIADGIEDSWDHRQAWDWHQQARRLFRLLEQARFAFERSRESMRLNPDRRRRAELRRLSDPYRHTLSVLEDLADYLSDLTRTLAEAAADTPAPPRPDGDSLAPYAQFLREAAAAVDAYGQMVNGEDPSDARNRLKENAHKVRTLHDRLRRTLAGDGVRDPEWAALYGSLLMDARRLTDDLLSEPPRPQPQHH
ncbi:FUSC family protein [Streptomyces sp. HMX87]|uniref:FUSC family protein n=1 Tax=Streptomyces sp. HMX87 TaxID=3390849 RepID=UPI003A8A8ECB